MRKTFLMIFLITLFAVPCWAADTEINISVEKGEDTEAAQAIAKVALAEQLAALGREQNSPMYLASAAQILSSIGTFEEVTREKTEEGDKAEGTKAPASVENTPESLYAEAINAAKAQGDDALVAVIENQSRLGGSRGRVGGSGVNRTRVYQRDYYDVRFVAGRRAAVSVSGDGDDLELYVYDSNGNLVASDAQGYRTYRSISWTPRWTGTFRIWVINPSDSVPYVDYRLTTN